MPILRAALLAFALVLTSALHSARAQTPGPLAVSIDPRLPAGSRLVDLSVRGFDKSDGLVSPSVYAVTTDLTGRLWIGTENGPMRFEGDRWKAEALPSSVLVPQTRGILQSADSSYWFATRSGVVRRQGTRQVLFAVEQGLPSPVVYSIIETSALTGTPQIVVGTGGGVAVFDGTRFSTVPLPDSLKPEGLMLGEARAPDGSLELWLASSMGKVGRYSKGRWSVYGAAEGLLSRSAEAIIPTRGDSLRRILVPGEGGLYAFRDDGPAGGRFEYVEGSPRLSYRAAEIMRADGTREVWVGTLRGVVMRRTLTGWDTVDVASLQPGGRVTSLVAINGHAGGIGVYIGTYGGRLARVGVGSVGRLETRGTRRDVTLAVLPEVAPNGRVGLWMGTLNAGVVHIDERGQLHEYSRQTGTDFSAVFALAMLPSQRRSTVLEGVGDDPPDLWIASDWGAFRREGSRMVERNVGMGRVNVHAFARGAFPDGTTSLIAATDAGLFRWMGAAWELVREIGPQPIRTLGVARDDGASTLWIALKNGLASMNANGFVFDTVALPEPAPSRSGSSSSRTNRSIPPSVRSLGRELVTAVCGVPGAASHGLTFAGTVNEGLWWRLSTTAWKRVPPELQRQWINRTIRSLSCVDERRLLVAVEQGVVTIDLRDADPAHWRILSVASQEDGLPATEINAFAPYALRGLVWAGTSRGVGAIQMERIVTPPLPVSVITLQSEGRPLDAEGALRLSAGRSDLFIQPTILSYHREGDSRYQVHLDRAGDPVRQASVEDDSLAWTDAPEAQYRSLSAGDYTLRVAARDYMGRVVNMPEMQFRVVPPVWLRWWAIALYIALIAGIMYSAHRWRLHTLERTNAQLATSERHMRSSERKFRALFDEASDAHLLIDDSHITSINVPARVLLGLPISSALNAHASREMLEWRSVLPLTLVREMDDLAANEETREYEILQPSGEIIPVSAQIASVPLDDRTLWHLVLRDLRSAREAEEVRRRLEEQVRDAQKFESLGTLAGGVAHDFNNLLGVIRGNVELAMDSLHDQNAVAAHLGTVFDASERARDLVRQILTFSRRSNSREEQVDVARLTRDLQPMLRSMIPTTVEIVVDVADDDLFVYGDSTQLQQILLNLASNAEYAMRSRGGGQLHIALDSLNETAIDSLDGRVIRLRVTDTGTGMSPAVIERVFEPFYTTKPVGEGTGLGMAVLHGIVASHGGRVVVSSTVDVGTTFEILLPAAEDDASRADVGTAMTSVRSAPTAYFDAGTTEEPEHSAIADCCIVVVDDEPAVARVSESALTRLGYDVRMFTDSVKALTFIQKDPYAVSLLITDQTMPGITGDVLSIEVHKLRPELPIIISSGYSYVLTAERLAEMGSPIVLQKPVSILTLRNAVESALEARSSQGAD